MPPELAAYVTPINAVLSLTMLALLLKFSREARVISSERAQLLAEQHQETLRQLAEARAKISQQEELAAHYAPTHLLAQLERAKQSAHYYEAALRDHRAVLVVVSEVLGAFAQAENSESVLRSLPRDAKLLVREFLCHEASRRKALDPARSVELARIAVKLHEAAELESAPPASLYSSLDDPIMPPLSEDFAKALPEHLHPGKIRERYGVPQASDPA